MRYYVRAEIERFLRAVDLALKRPATVIVIGGGAAALKYRIDDPTTDIDTFNALGADLRLAIDAARKATGLAMPFEQSGVADGPYEFEDRLLRALPRLSRLTVLVPERHDRGAREAGRLRAVAPRVLPRRCLPRVLDRRSGPVESEAEDREVLASDTDGRCRRQRVAESTLRAVPPGVRVVATLIEHHVAVEPRAHHIAR